jgi:hypothetical protein
MHDAQCTIRCCSMDETLLFRSTIYYANCQPPLHCDDLRGSTIALWRSILYCMSKNSSNDNQRIPRGPYRPVDFSQCLPNSVMVAGQCIGYCLSDCSVCSLLIDYVVTTNCFRCGRAGHKAANCVQRSAALEVGMAALGRAIVSTSSQYDFKLLTFIKLSTFSSTSSPSHQTLRLLIKLSTFIRFSIPLTLHVSGFGFS